MRFSSFFLLFIIVLVGLISFLVLNLNSHIVHLDLLFYELDISLGISILIFFITGALITGCLEFIYFIKKRGNKVE